MALKLQLAAQNEDTMVLDLKRQAEDAAMARDLELQEIAIASNRQAEDEAMVRHLQAEDGKTAHDVM